MKKRKKGFFFCNPTDPNIVARQGHFNVQTKSIDNSVDDLYYLDPQTNELSMLIPLYDGKGDIRGYGCYRCFEDDAPEKKSSLLLLFFKKMEKPLTQVWY